MSEPIALHAPLTSRVGMTGFAIGIAIVAVIAAAALIGNSLILHDPFTQDLGNRLKPPFWMEGTQPGHPLGTDQLGRDYLARLAYGARISRPLDRQGWRIRNGGQEAPRLFLSQGEFADAARLEAVTWPVPRPGLVIGYSYLWEREARAIGPIRSVKSCFALFDTVVKFWGRRPP